jgi:hypothetical protein
MDYITKALHIFNQEKIIPLTEIPDNQNINDKQIKQVLFNRNYIEVEESNVKGGYLCETSDGFRYIIHEHYNTTTDRSKTEDLKKFHNLGVKSILIDVVCTKGTVLIDYAVGRGGDLNKWNKNKIKFVLGIDISKDNIHNPKGGVCSRYIGIKKKFGSVIDGLFIL